MQNNLLFFQSTVLGGQYQTGLSDLINLHLQQQNDLFTTQQIIVPNQAMAVWLKDQLTRKNQICANVDCVVLAGTVIDNIYLANNPEHQLCDFAAIKYVIYELLLEQDLANFPDLLEFLYDERRQIIDKLRAYELAAQLANIYHEYVYLRTDEMLNMHRADFTLWQKFIWQQVLSKIGDKKTFLDVYQYFNKANVISQLPSNLYVFGLTSSYPSQLKILIKIAQSTNVYWYYQSCSNYYYGDLLSEKAKSKIEQRLLRKPDLIIDDLYLTSGNRLLSNLGQQSREFVELLRVNDVNVYEFEPTALPEVTINSTMLQLLQTDIRNLHCRIRKELRLVNDDYMVEPISLSSLATGGIYDLNTDESSIKINVCHNRMREVQVMFNQLVLSLANNPDLTFADILITAPDIDDYASYIQAVFDNEYILDSNQEKCFLPYFITGNRRHQQIKILQSLHLVLSNPYQLKVSNLLEILQDSEIQHGLGIDFNDIDLIKQWMQDNHTHFGYAAADFDRLGYIDYPIYGFKQLLINLVLGSCIDGQTFLDNAKLPYVSIKQQVYVPYDNLDNAEFDLANKLILLVELLEQSRQFFYLDEHNYHEHKLEEIIVYLGKFADLFIKDDDIQLVFDQFIGHLRSVNNLKITLPVLLPIIDDYLGLMKNRLSLNGKITCMSMQYARNLPFAHVYILGMNFGEYPKTYQPNQLSILATQWYLADRNYNIEDKQAFLDIVLATTRQLTISYIGRKETDNSEIKPSPVLGLLLEVLGQSIINFWHEPDNLLELKYDYLNVIEYHALHPFYNNQHKNYSQIWHRVSQLTRDNITYNIWDFSVPSPIKLASKQFDKYLNITIKDLFSTVKYINHNLYRVIGLNTFANEINLEDNEPLNTYDRSIAKQMWLYCKKYADKFDSVELAKYMHYNGVINYAEVGQSQFDYYYKAYNYYSANCGKPLEFSLDYQLVSKTGKQYDLSIKDVVYVENEAIVICDDFVNLKNGNDAAKNKVTLDTLSYNLKMRGLIVYVLLDKATQFRQQYSINKFILRNIYLDNSHVDVIFSVNNPSNVLPRLLAFYLRSLTNPTLIHEKAILASVAKKTKLSKNLNGEVVDEVADALLSSYKNAGRDKLLQDIIYRSWLQYYPFIGEFNDLEFLGSLLSEMR